MFKNHSNTCLHVFWHLNDLIFVLHTSEKSGRLFAFISNNTDVCSLASIQTEALICSIHGTLGTEITKLLLIPLDIRQAISPPRSIITLAISGLQKWIYYQPLDYSADVLNLLLPSLMFPKLTVFKVFTNTV